MSDPTLSIDREISGRPYLFTSESVSAGHPDKLADRISDTVLDAFLERDPTARVACETFLADNLVVLAGEFRTTPPGLCDLIREAAPNLVRQVLRDTGYDSTFPGIDPDRCEILVRFNQQSSDISRGVDQDDRLGAGDQGMMFGYACKETPELMPLPIMLAHRMVQRQADLLKSGKIPWLRPDAKSQVTVRYRGHHPLSIETVVFSTQHTEEINLDILRNEVLEQIIVPVIPKDLQQGMRTLINPTGRFTIGGPKGDTGLTGRKIIVDTYGGACPHGGGAFSGKDPSKVDRSAAYMARYMAKNIIAAGLADRCTIQIAYAIGMAEPMSLFVDTHGTGKVNDTTIEQAIRAVFDLTPAGIIKTLDLCRPIYAQTAAYGHFGRDGLPWERTDRVEKIQRVISIEKEGCHA
ncbi:methionine adenosyltransferase [Desulfobulbus alkaliphilus]|uniref:methionine adenosyltransferase n=1 Tax=Desulfobulbus alkaliphilus TaxID=869814 RepID=UPI001F0552C0|nr:methionine adenosyltransferase [Desulfobulbus alkaliphilus]